MSVMADLGWNGRQGSFKMCEMPLRADQALAGKGLTGVISTGIEECIAIRIRTSPRSRHQLLHDHAFVDQSGKCGMAWRQRGVWKRVRKIATLTLQSTDRVISSAFILKWGGYIMLRVRRRLIAPQVCSHGWLSARREERRCDSPVPSPGRLGVCSDW